MFKRRLQNMQTVQTTQTFLINLLFFSFFYLDLLKVCLHILFTFCYGYRCLEATGMVLEKIYNQCPSGQQF